MSQEKLRSNNPDILGAPAENFSRGLLSVDLHPDFGPKIEGKVRDNWVVEEFGERIMITTDRQSAFDRLICTVPGKGKVLNLQSAFWFKNTRDIVHNHMRKILHPNVLIARQAEKTFPVEVVFRRDMAKSSTSTSVYTNYFGDESRDIPARRKIYGIEFPEGLQPNQEFPMGTICTPTTKSEIGHDEELTDEEARDIVDSKLGYGVWKKAKAAGFALFERARPYHEKKGLILADTKLEFGLDKDGNLMLIDEVFTPDSSRFWLADTYEQRFREGKDPENFDKEILRRWLADNGFKGEKGKRVPVVDQEVIDQMELAYKTPYEMVTGKNLPETPTDPLALEREIQQAVNKYYNR